MPQALTVSDCAGRSCLYLPVGLDRMPNELRPQDEDLPTALRFRVVEYATEDDMPLTIHVADPEGRWCLYEAIKVDGREVDSKGFETVQGPGSIRAVRH